MKKKVRSTPFFAKSKKQPRLYNENSNTRSSVKTPQKKKSKSSTLVKKSSNKTRTNDRSVDLSPKKSNTPRKTKTRKPQPRLNPQNKKKLIGDLSSSKIKGDRNITIKNKPRKRKTKVTRSQPQGVVLIIALLIRLAVVTVGISTIFGSLIAIADSMSVTSTLEGDNREKIIKEKSDRNSEELKKIFPPGSIGKEITDLKKQLLKIVSQFSDLKSGVFVADLDSNNYVNIEAETIFSAASTIKVPVLVAFFQDVDAGKISLDEKFTLTKEVIAPHAGTLQYEKLGSKFTALDVAKKMIIISDNTATNMLIERLGGMEKLNQRFTDWGMNVTKIRNPLPDLEGTNTSSPQDLGNLMVKIDRGQLVSPRSRDRILEIMSQTKTNTLLSPGLGKGAKIAHKTGDIRSLLGDVGIIDMPNGKRYVASVLVKRPDQNPQAKTIINKISQTAYKYFDR